MSATLTSSTPDATRYLDPRVVMRIKNLELRARVVVEGFFAGIHRSPYHGFSVEFSEYRAYTPGDDPRYLDWRLFARSDRYSVKRFEDETNLHCHLLVDMSRSMAFGSGTYTKSEYARTLAASLAHFMHAQRDAVGLITFAADVADYLPPRHRAGHLRRLFGMLDRDPAGRGTDLSRPLERIAKNVRKRGLVVLISDFLAPVDEFRTRLGYLRSRGHDVLVLQVLDPSELDLRFESPQMYEDLESGRRLYIDPESVRTEYRRRFDAHAAALKQACLDLGVDFTRLATDQPLEIALFDLLNLRERRGRRIARRAGRARRAAT
jgi:uncharacterized protein (DUF58 family)